MIILEEIDKLNNLISTKEIEIIVKNFLLKKKPDPKISLMNSTSPLRKK